MRQDLISVSELLKEMKETINQNERLQNVALVGEVSNFSAHRSGHFYFNLKDANARIACVMFRSSASKIKFHPKEGDKVVLVGHVSVFELSGAIQFYANKMVLDGLGQLHQQFERLKLDYQAKGYFNPEHKKALPLFPKTIALITGANSAAYADMMRTIQERWPLVKVNTLFSLVQGPGAKEEITARIKQANDLQCDVIILARGGGSIEDLWAFNEPEVVEAIWHSKQPIVSGIGHESDTTLSDFVADFRAATPTGAIVSVLPLQSDMYKQLRDYMNQYYLSLRRKLQKEQLAYQTIMNHAIFKNPMQLIERKAHVLDYYKQQFNQTLRRFDDILMKIKTYQLKSQQSIESRLYRSDQWQVQYQENSFRMVQMRLEQQKSQVLLISEHQRSQLQYKQRQITQKQRELGDLHQRLLHQGSRHLRLNKKAFVDIINVMESRSPLKIMAKGYALTYHGDQLVKSVDDINLNDAITLYFKDGEASAIITKKESKHERI